MIPLLDIQPKEINSVCWRDLCILRFTAAPITSQEMDVTEVFIIWWMDKENLVHTHNWILFSHRKEWNLVIYTTWMKLELSMLGEIRQTQKDILPDFTDRWNIKKLTSEKLTVEWWLPEVRKNSGGERNGERLINGTKFKLDRNKKFWCAILCTVYQKAERNDFESFHH
jgi:hypothetical protein